MWQDGKLQTEYVSIQVTNKHIHCRGEWVMHVREFNWNCKPLEISTDASLEVAQHKALEMVRNHLQHMLNSLTFNE